MTLATYSVDEKNDLYLDDDNSIAVVYDAEAVSQTVRHAHRTLLGELPYAQEDGIPYEQAVWTGNPDLVQINYYFDREAQKQLKVVRVIKSSVELNNNTLSYDSEISSEYGTLYLNGKV